MRARAVSGQRSFACCQQMAMCTGGLVYWGLVLVLGLKLAMLIGMATGMPARLGVSNGVALTTAHSQRS